MNRNPARAFPGSPLGWMNFMARRASPLSPLPGAGPSTPFMTVAHVPPAAWLATVNEASSFHRG